MNTVRLTSAVVAGLVAAWHRDNLADIASRAGAAAIEQLDGASDDLVKRLENSGAPTAETLDEWFAERIKRPPVSQDTELYNAVHASLADLRARLGIKVDAAPADQRATFDSSIQ